MLKTLQLGPYRIVRELGAGGMGEVYLAHDDRLDRPVAIKRLRLHGERTDELRRRFQREARLAARLNHPAIVQIYDLVQDGERDCIVMEYVAGRTLREQLERGASLLDVLDWARQIAEGMAAAHEAGIIHRDLKSENVLVTPTGQVKITDFGIAKRLDDEPLTADSAIVGTLRAMSPEQASGQPLDHRTDLFSFGVLLYEALTTQSPFVAESPLVTLQRVVNVPHRPVMDWVPEIPAPLSAFIDRLLAKNPALRPRDFREVARTLADLGGDREETGARAGLGWPAQWAVASTRPEPVDNISLRPRSGSADRDRDRDRDVSTDTSALADTLAPGSRDPEGPASAAKEIGEAETALKLGPPATGLDPPPHSPRPQPPTRKDLRRRGPAGLAALAVLAALATGTWALRARLQQAQPSAPAPPTPSRPLYVTVLAPQASGSGVGDLALRATSLRHMLLGGLGDLDGVVAQAPEEVDRIQTASSSLRGLARALDADELVTSRLDCSPTSCTATLSRVRGSDAALVWTQAFAIPSDVFFGATGTVLAQLRRGYADHPLRPGAAAPDVSAEDYQAYLALYEESRHSAQGLVPAAFTERLAALRQRAPGFIDVYLLEADLARVRYYQSHDRVDLQRARQLVEAARRIAPAATEAVAQSFKVALAGGEAERAVADLAALERLGADQATLWQLRARLAEQGGDLGQAIDLLKKAAGLHPSWRILLDLATAELHRGESAAARQHLEALLARVPDHFGAQSDLAQLELVSGRAERAAELYAALTQRTSGFVELSNLGIAQLLLGQFAEARDSLDRARALQPQNPAAVFNLADAELLLGHLDVARGLYQRSLALLDAQHDESWPARTSRAQALGHLGESARAVAELQQALRLAPAQNGDAAYAAAVVYALVGDAASTLVNATKAIDLGYAPHWFSFPWFDALRRDPRFVAASRRDRGVSR